jgi:hypothetical protein
MKGPLMVVGERVVVATAVRPLASDLPIIPEPISFFGRIWPVVGLVAAIVVNVAWMGFLGYGFFKLVGPAFF